MKLNISSFSCSLQTAKEFVANPEDVADFTTSIFISVQIRHRGLVQGHWFEKTKVIEEDVLFLSGWCTTGFFVLNLLLV
jgi:hypothetical protein